VALQVFEGHTFIANAVAFSPDGKQLASGSNDRTIRLRDTTTGAALQTLEGHTYVIGAVASNDQTVRLWDVATGAALQTFKGHTYIVGAVTFSADGKQLASAFSNRIDRLKLASIDKTVRLWGSTAGAALQTLFARKDPIKLPSLSAC
jgi:WD40 repeat protein